MKSDHPVYFQGLAVGGYYFCAVIGFKLDFPVFGKRHETLAGPCVYQEIPSGILVLQFKGGGRGVVPHGAGHAIAFFVGPVLVVAVQRVFRREKMFNVIQ